MNEDNPFDNFVGYLDTALKLKIVMHKRGIRIARCVCPHCEVGEITGTLNGRKDHIHARCSTPSCLVVME